VTVVDASLGHVVATLNAQNVFDLGFSPLGTYIITWQRPSKDENGDATKNLKIWKTIDENVGEDGERVPVGRYVQKNPTGWNLQYTADEKYCARCVTNEVQFYESHDMGTVWKKLRAEGVTDFAITPSGKNLSVAVFIPERKGQPAAVKVFNVPAFDAPVSQKSFFKSDKVQLKWNEMGTSLIVLASTDVDKTNKSYYGETNMYILSAAGGFDARIDLGKPWLIMTSIYALTILQTRRARSMMSTGHRTPANLVSFMDTCPRRRPFSTNVPRQSTTSISAPETPFFSPHTVVSSLSLALETWLVKWTFTTSKRTFSRSPQSRLVTRHFVSGVLMASTSWQLRPVLVFVSRMVFVSGMFWVVSCTART